MVYSKKNNILIIGFIAIQSIFIWSAVKLKAQNKHFTLQDNKIYDVDSVNTAPAYPGGIIKLYNFLNHNIKYPKTAAKASIQGHVYVSFVVEKDGSLHHFKIHKSLGYGTGQELVRVLSTAKRWNPAMLNGKPVRVKRKIPFKYSLEKKELSAAITISDANKLKKYIKPNKAPLFIVDGEYMVAEKFKAISFNEFLKIEIITNPDVTALHEKIVARNGIVIARTKTAEKRFLENISRH